MDQGKPCPDELAVTDTYLNFEAARQVRPNASVANLGEQAAVEVIEDQQRIQSADAVFDRAIAAGRHPSRVEKFVGHDPEIRNAVRETLELFSRRDPDH